MVPDARHSFCCKDETVGSTPIGGLVRGRTGYSLRSPNRPIALRERRLDAIMGAKREIAAARIATGGAHMDAALRTEMTDVYPLDEPAISFGSPILGRQDPDRRSRAGRPRPGEFGTV